MSESLFQDFKEDVLAGVPTLSQNITLSDLMNDGAFRLCCADINSKLKVFKVDSLESEHKLSFSPISIVSFYAPDPNSKQPVPFLAIAGISYIYIYKNMKGTFKLLIPKLEINQVEQAVWDELADEKLDNDQAITRLREIFDDSKSFFNIQSKSFQHDH